MVLVNDNEVLTRIAGGAVTAAIDLTMNAVKLVKQSATAGKVVSSTDGATKYEVVGAVESIGPPVNDQEDIATDDVVGVRRKGIVNLQLAKGENAADGALLGAAANGQVKVVTFSSTPTAAESLAVIAQAREAKDASSAAKAIEAELLL